MNKFLGSIAAAAVVALGNPASAAVVFGDFTINETVIGGSNAALPINKLTGSYEERLTVTGPGTFAAQVYGTFGSYLSNDGTSNLFDGYRMYIVIAASGTINGTNSFVSTNSTLNLYLDPNSDTTATLSDGLTSPLLADLVDDSLLAASTSQSLGNASLDATSSKFSFEWGDFMLTAFGETFFISPRPFFIDFQVDGDSDTVVDGTLGTRIISGDLSAVFLGQQVPEPTSLALFSLALVGAGFARRRASRRLQFRRMTIGLP